MIPGISPLAGVQRSRGRDIASPVSPLGKQSSLLSSSARLVEMTRSTPHEVLRRVFGFGEFRAHQREAVEMVCGGRSVLVVLPTGGGKSLVYQVPALVREGVALVFSPLIALMRDQVDQLRAVGVRAAFLNSSLPWAERDAVCAQALRGEVDILYVAPEGFFTERFQDFLADLCGSRHCEESATKQSHTAQPTVAGEIACVPEHAPPLTPPARKQGENHSRTSRNDGGSASRVSLIAVDEAHCISEWGHEFRPEYRQLRSLRERFPDVPIVAATATATAQVRADIVQQLGVPDMETIVGSFERTNLTLHIERAQDATAQVAAVLARHRGEAGIVYAATRKRVEELSDALNATGFRTLPYHAGMDADTRTAHQRAFANDEIQTIVATVAFGMGIDKSNIRYVVHANLPKSIEGYYQEVGRAGRDGLPSECVTFYANGDIATQQYLIEQAENEDERARATRQLERIVRFVRTVECRHRAVLQYFGEERGAWTCGDRCDACRAGDVEERDATDDVRKVLAAVAQITQRGGMVGAGKITQMLAGSSSDDVARFQKLPSFGTMRGRTQSAIRDVIGLCVDRGFLMQEAGKYPVLRLADSARGVLQGGERVIVRVRRTQEVAHATSHETALFEELRQWRATEARRQNVPPYVICSDKVLVDLSTYLPTTMSDLPRIPGIGTVRAERFGAAILAIIRAYIESHGLTPRMDLLSPSSRGGAGGGGVSAISNLKSQIRSQSDTVAETLTLHQQGKSVSQIAQHRALNPRTIVSHIATMLRDGRIPSGDLRKFLPENREQEIRHAFTRIGSLAALAPVKEILPPTTSYDDLHLVRAVMLREADGV